MRLEFLLQHEKETSITKNKLKQKVDNSLKGCFDVVSGQHLEFAIDKKTYQVSYYISQYEINTKGIEGAICYLTLETELKAFNAAKLLDKANERLLLSINKGEDRFCVIPIFDDRSKYFSIKAFPYFCDFETKLRHLILKLLTKSFGVLWAQKTLTQEMQAELKKRLRGADYRKLSEQALYEMDFFMLQDYLFGKTRQVQPEEIVDIRLCDANLANLSTKEIQEIIALAKPKSIWERYFVDDVTIPNLEDKLSEIRISRNKIAHNKKYEYKDFIKDRKVLVEFSKQIDTAIEKIDIKPIDPSEAVVTVGSFLGQDFQGISSVIISLNNVFKDSVFAKEKFGETLSVIAKGMEIYENNISEIRIGLTNLLKHFVSVTYDFKMPALYLTENSVKSEELENDEAENDEVKSESIESDSSKVNEE